jgi:enoyl-CoA hydratase/carnithine racemase
MTATENHTAELINYTVSDMVAVIVLNRPDRLNAWNPPLETAYVHALRRATTDSGVRAVVVAGAGRAFCAGADKSVLDAIEDRGSADGAIGDRRLQLQDFEPAVPKPVIAAVHGHCVGIGLAHALSCDIRFTTANASWSAPFARLGLVAEQGTAWLIQRIAGYSTAADLLLTGRAIRGDEAYRLGLADHLIDGDVLAAAVTYASEIAQLCAPSALAVIKSQLQHDTKVDLCTAADKADELTLGALSGADFAESMRAVRERRRPRFAGLRTLPFT